ncbi:MAG: hypothetical protein HYU75_13420, partial [Betaproteobacteria bacterium]|nr:hypothetical protein [Betaproteobacteria bacterium]
MSELDWLPRENDPKNHALFDDQYFGDAAPHYRALLDLPVAALQLVFTLLLFSCGGRETARATDPAPSAKRVTLRMNLTPSLTNAAVMIARDEGEFEREGIDAVFVTIDPSSANLAVGTG